MNNIKLFIEGFIIGLGKIMPGVSGSILAICFGIYEQIVACLSNFKTLKNNIKFLTILGMGIGFAIILGSNIISYFLEYHFLYTLFLFIGMMLPGIIPLFKEVKSENVTFSKMIIATLVFTFLILLSTVNFNADNIIETNYISQAISLFLCGIIDAGATIIPGISGSALLMILGYYEIILKALAGALTLNTLPILFPFFLGIIVGVILISKLITYLFRHHRILTYMLIIVFSCFSVISLLIKGLNTIVSLFELIFCLMYLILGITANILLEKIFKNN